MGMGLGIGSQGSPPAGTINLLHTAADKFSECLGQKRDVGEVLGPLKFTSSIPTHTLRHSKKLLCNNLTYFWKYIIMLETKDLKDLSKFKIGSLFELVNKPVEYAEEISDIIRAVL